MEIKKKNYKIWVVLVYFLAFAVAFPNSTFRTRSANRKELIDSEESEGCGLTCTTIRVLLFFSKLSCNK